MIQRQLYLEKSQNSLGSWSAMYQFGHYSADLDLSPLFLKLSLSPPVSLFSLCKTVSVERIVFKFLSAASLSLYRRLQEMKSLLSFVIIFESDVICRMNTSESADVCTQIV